MNSIGIGPDCLCIKENYRFDPSKWRCYHGLVVLEEPEPSACPDSSQKWPQCDVSIDGTTLLSLIG